MKCDIWIVAVLYSREKGGRGLAGASFAPVDHAHRMDLL